MEQIKLAIEQINIVNVFLIVLSFLLIMGTKPLYQSYKQYIYGDTKKSMLKEHIAFFSVIYIFILFLFNINYEDFLESSLSFDRPDEIWYNVVTNGYDAIYQLQNFDTFPEYFDKLGLTYFNPIEPNKPEKPKKDPGEFERDYEEKMNNYEAELEQYEQNLAQYKEDKALFEQQWETFAKENVINTPAKAYRDITSHPELTNEDGYLYVMDVDTFKMFFASKLWEDNQIKISKDLSENIFTSNYIINLRLNQQSAFLLPNYIALMAPAIFFTIIAIRFIYLPLKTPKLYLAELRNINRFTAFLNYNVKFNNNESNLLIESLRGIEQDYFFDFAGQVFTSETVSSKDKYEEVSSVFNFQFLSLYFSLFQVMLNEGVTEEGLNSLELAQFQGEKYYKSIDMLFQAKKSALSSVRMVVIVIGGAVPLLTKKNVTDLYLCYLYSDGYMMTIVFYCVIIGIFAIAVRTYSDNKIIRKEGRYI